MKIFYEPTQLGIAAKLGMVGQCLLHRKLLSTRLSLSSDFRIILLQRTVEDLGVVVKVPLEVRILKYRQTIDLEK